MEPNPIEALSRHLGQNLRSIRELRGLTQQQLANLCEMPRSTVEADPQVHTLSHKVDCQQLFSDLKKRV